MSAVSAESIGNDQYMIRQKSLPGMNMPSSPFECECQITHQFLFTHLAVPHLLGLAVQLIIQDSQVTCLTAWREAGWMCSLKPT